MFVCVTPKASKEITKQKSSHSSSFSLCAVSVYNSGRCWTHIFSLKLSLLENVPTCCISLLSKTRICSDMTTTEGSWTGGSVLFQSCWIVSVSLSFYSSWQCHLAFTVYLMLFCNLFYQYDNKYKNSSKVHKCPRLRSWSQSVSRIVLVVTSSEAKKSALSSLHFVVLRHRDMFNHHSHFRDFKFI